MPKEHHGRNPTWTRDELILALHFYLQHREAIPDSNSDAISQLSSEISSLAKRLDLSGTDTLRNVNGVHMKLMNFRSRDPEYIAQGKSGLTRGNKLEATIWELFAYDPEQLERIVRTIKACLHDKLEWGNDTDEGEVAEAEEGRILTRFHRTRERSRGIVQKKKKAFEKKHGHLFCEACKFGFTEFHDERVKSVIECHHLRPVCSLEPGEKTKLDDLVLLCVNCHRMVHAKRPWLSFSDLKELMLQKN